MACSFAQRRHADCMLLCVGRFLFAGWCVLVVGLCVVCWWLLDVISLLVARCCAVLSIYCVWSMYACCLLANMLLLLCVAGWRLVVA